MKRLPLLEQFQTPVPVARYMASLIPPGVKTVLEPTPGKGNLVSMLSAYNVTAPHNFFDLPGSSKFDCVVMNPPFSATTAYGLPPDLVGKGNGVGYYIFSRCLGMADNVIALMPWYVLIDSDKRYQSLVRFGLISVTALPRSTFNFIKVQTAVLQLQRGYVGRTTLLPFGSAVRGNVTGL